MFKFFQKIRRTMLSEGKTGKYFKYAIGEIVLVVIGILIALSINNWNSNRVLKQEELKILKSLKEEFGQNLANFDSSYTFHLTRRRSIVRVMSPGIENMPLDSLSVLIGNVGNNLTFDPYQGIYNAVINSGKIELISNDALKQKISKFQDLLTDYQEEESYTMDFTQNNLYPFVIANRKMDFNTFYSIRERTPEEKRLLREDLLSMIRSDTYENLLVFIYGYMREIFVEGPMLRAEMVSIIGLLEDEIEALGQQSWQ